MIRACEDGDGLWKCLAFLFYLNLKPQTQKAFSFCFCICRDLRWREVSNIFPKSTFFVWYSGFGVGYFSPCQVGILIPKCLHFLISSVSGLSQLTQIFSRIFVCSNEDVLYHWTLPLCLNCETNCLSDKFPHLFRCFPARSFQEL